MGWRWRALTWEKCTYHAGMLKGWVACPAPTCKGPFTQHPKQFQCTAEYMTMGICDAVGSSGTQHKSLLREGSSKVYSCNPGEWVPLTRPLECPNKKYGFYWNGTWTVTTTTPPTPDCDEFEDEASCPARCSWLAPGRCRENPCSSFGKDQCPQERCRVEGEKCKIKECKEFSEQGTCPSHCTWDKELG